MEDTPNNNNASGNNNVEDKDLTNLSTGDNNVTAIEMAVGKYRKESGQHGGTLGDGTTDEAGRLLTKGEPPNADYINLTPEQKQKQDQTVKEYLDEIKDSPNLFSGVAIFNNTIPYKDIIPGHCYSFKVNKDGNIKLTNPWDTKNDTTVLTPDEFMKNYGGATLYS